MAEYYVATTGDDTTGDGSEGNPWASPGHAANNASGSDLIWVKSGTYTLTTDTVNADEGPPSLATDVKMEGYETTTGDLGEKPVISAGVLTGIALGIVRFATTGLGGDYNAVRNIKVDGVDSSNEANNRGIYGNQTYSHTIRDCEVINCNYGFFGTTTSSRFINCVVRDCVFGFHNGTSAVGCLAEGCTFNGFNGVTRLYGCVAMDCGEEGFDFGTAWPYSAIHCVAYNNTENGFSGTRDLGMLVGCISVSNGAYGYEMSTGGHGLLVACASYDNTSGRIRNTSDLDFHPVVLTGDPFTDAPNEDFSLNDTAGAGAACKNVAIDNVFGEDNSYLDLGAILPDSGSGGNTIIVIED